MLLCFQGDARHVNDVGLHGNRDVARGKGSRSRGCGAAFGASRAGREGRRRCGGWSPGWEGRLTAMLSRGGGRQQFAAENLGREDGDPPRARVLEPKPGYPGCPPPAFVSQLQPGSAALSSNKSGGLERPTLIIRHRSWTSTLDTREVCTCPFGCCSKAAPARCESTGADGRRKGISSRMRPNSSYPSL